MATERLDVPRGFAHAGVDATGERLGPIMPTKVFAQPFRLAFKKEEDVLWIEVRSLAGLRNVAQRVESGDLEEIDRLSTLEMQLWGHLAEHCGFLRVMGSASTLAAGLQPLGEETAALAEDLATFTGGDEVAALNFMNDMKKSLAPTKPVDTSPVSQHEATNEFFKPDNVNLTERGEDVLHKLVYGDLPTADSIDSAETTAFRKESENAVEIFQHFTPPATPEEIAAEAQEALACRVAAETGDTEGPVITGPEAAMQGRLVADTFRGLDNPEDKKIQEDASLAVEIALGPDTQPEVSDTEAEERYDGTLKFGDQTVVPDQTTDDHKSNDLGDTPSTT